MEHPLTRKLGPVTHGFRRGRPIDYAATLVLRRRPVSYAGALCEIVEVYRAGLNEEQVFAIARMPHRPDWTDAEVLFVKGSEIDDAAFDGPKCIEELEWDIAEAKRIEAARAALR